MYSGGFERFTNNRYKSSWYSSKRRYKIECSTKVESVDFFLLTTIMIVIEILSGLVLKLPESVSVTCISVIATWSLWKTVCLCDN